MIDHEPEAETIFRGVAKRHGLTISRDLEAPDEFMFDLVSGVDGEAVVTLGLQNGDELNFGVHDFWSYFFPFERVKGLFEKAVEGWFTGQTRLVYRWRGQRLIKIELQVKVKASDWERVYTELRSMIFPFWTTRATIKSHASSP